LAFFFQSCLHLCTSFYIQPKHHKVADCQHNQHLMVWLFSFSLFHKYNIACYLKKSNTDYQ
jgi:hypothetical protein